MKVSLRVRLLGTIVGAVVLFFIVSGIAARITLQRDLMSLGKTQVTDGAKAFGGFWKSRQDQIKLLISQDAVADALRKDLQSHNSKALQDQLSNVARTSGLSWLTVVDDKGNVVARANGPQLGSLASNSYIQRALTGETVSTAALLPASELQAEGLAAQAATSIKGAGGKTVGQISKGLALIAAAPMSDRNERTIGAIYGGVLMNHFYDLVDQSTLALGGSTAILEGNDIIASSILAPDGMRVFDRRVPVFNAAAQSGGGYTGVDTEGHRQYLVHIAPIQNDQNTVIGALWYGQPLSQITDIIDHTTQSLILWGIVAMIIALALAIPIVERVSRTLAQRSRQVRDAAKELGVIIVGSEVSGDHVSATKAVVERSGALIEQISAAGDPSGKVGELKALNDELQGDIMVIDTLSQEMNSRMQQAVDRVSELNDVAGGLNRLVSGETN
ncbi:MAG: cache domain-containing protein [Vulcanimicrobiaceae bacterium]